MVTVKVQDASGNVLGEMELKAGQNLLDQCADSNIDLPFSCHAGACMSCAATIVSGAEFLDQEVDGQKYIETDDNVCLTCIAGPKEEFVNTADKNVVELQMLM